jgi:hypothetical protein
MTDSGFNPMVSVMTPGSGATAACQEYRWNYNWMAQSQVILNGNPKSRLIAFRVAQRAPAG